MHTHHLPNLLPILVDVTVGTLIVIAYRKIRRFFRRR